MDEKSFLHGRHWSYQDEIPKSAPSNSAWLRPCWLLGEHTAESCIVFNAETTNIVVLQKAEKKFLQVNLESLLSCGYKAGRNDLLPIAVTSSDIRSLIPRRILPEHSRLDSNFGLGIGRSFSHEHTPEVESERYSPRRLGTNTILRAKFVLSHGIIYVCLINFETHNRGRIYFSWVWVTHT